MVARGGGWQPRGHLLAGPSLSRSPPPPPSLSPSLSFSLSLSPLTHGTPRRRLFSTVYRRLFPTVSRRLLSAAMTDAVDWGDSDTRLGYRAPADGCRRPGPTAVGYGRSKAASDGGGAPVTFTGHGQWSRSVVTFTGHGHGRRWLAHRSERHSDAAKAQQEPQCA